MTNLGFTEQ